MGHTIRQTHVEACQRNRVGDLLLSGRDEHLHTAPATNAQQDVREESEERGKATAKVRATAGGKRNKK